MIAFIRGVALTFVVIGIASAVITTVATIVIMVVSAIQAIARKRNKDA